jgi:lysyl-tRNA synthetase class 2
VTGTGARWKPGASRETLRLRARVLRDIREWFWSRGVLEVDTPALSAAVATDPNIESFSVRSGSETYHLHTSPEFAMKRLLAAGSGDIYQMCHVFRDGEAGSRHNPEFTMLEWYRTGIDMHAMMDEVESLVRAVCADHGPLGDARRVSYRDLFLDTMELDPFEAGADSLAAALEAAGIPPPEGPGQDRDALLDLLLGTVLEPALDPTRPTFVHDFPVSQAALARVRPGSPPVAERFELFLGGMELANGFRELTDSTEQAARFESDLADRAAKGRPGGPVDHRFLEALRAGLPECSGVALGLDRLLMFLSGAEAIGDVLSFDITRA